LAAALTIACWLLAIGHGEITTSDGHEVYAVAQSIVDHQDLNSSLARGEGVKGQHGAYYSKYGIGASVLAAIPYVLAKPLARALPSRRDKIEQAAVSLLMPACIVLLVLALYRLGMLLGASEVSALLVAGGAVFGTFLLPYAQDFFTEPITVLLLVLSVLLAVERRPGWAGGAFGMAILVRPQLVVLAPALVIYLLIADGRRAAVLALPWLGVAVALVCAYNAVRFGSLTDTGYRAPVDPGLTTPIWRGTAGLLFDPAKSLLLFAPVTLLLPAAFADGWRSQRLVIALLSVMFLATFVMAAMWHSWEGGWSWGPRLLLPGLVPFLVILAPWAGRSRQRARLLATALAAGLIVSFATVIVPTQAQQLDRPPPRHGPEIVRQAALIPTTIRRTIHSAAGDHAHGGNHRRYVNTWQVGVLRDTGWSGFAAASVVTFFLLAGAAFGAVSLRSALRYTELP